MEDRNVLKSLLKLLDINHILEQLAIEIREEDV
jgi:hypothetical protein